MTPLNVVDSSAWLEYFADTDRAAIFEAPIEDVEHLLVPSIVLLEVVKKVCRERGELVASRIAMTLQVVKVLDLTRELAIDASRLKLPLADSIIYATTLKYDATLWTQDAHLKDLPNVRYFEK